MSSRGVQKRGKITTKRILNAIGEDLTARGYKPEDFKRKEEDKLPMPIITTIQGPWKILYSQERAIGRSVIVQLEFGKEADPCEYDFGMYWQNVDNDSEQGVLRAHSDEHHTKWIEDPDSDGETHLIWYSGGIEAPKRVGRFKLMFKVVPKGTELERRDLEASDFALKALVAGYYQADGEEQDYVEVLDHEEYPTEQQLQRTRAGGPDRK